MGHLLPSVNHDEYFWFLVVEASLFAPLKLSFSSVRDFRYIVLKHKRYITTRQDPFILHQGPKPIVFHYEHIFFQNFRCSFNTNTISVDLVKIFSLKHYRLATDLLGVEMVLPTFKSTFYILKYKEGERVSTYNDTVSLGSAFRDQSFFEACFYHYMDCLLRRLFRSAPTTLWSLDYYRSRGSYGFTIFHFGCLLLICTCFALRPISLPVNTF